MTRFALETHYLGAQEPHVLHYDDPADVVEAAAHRRRVHTGVACTVVRTVRDGGHPGLVALPGSQAVLQP